MTPNKKIDFLIDTILGISKVRYKAFNIILAGKCLSETEHYDIGKVYYQVKTMGPHEDTTLFVLSTRSNNL